jgi:hypothetical protein
MRVHPAGGAYPHVRQITRLTIDTLQEFHLQSHRAFVIITLLFFAQTVVFVQNARAESPGDRDSDGISFEADVRPILKAHCLECHGEGEEIEGGLDLRLRRFILDGGDSGPAVVEGEPDESPLFDRTSSEEMPPGDTKFTHEELATIRKWISSGAKALRAEPESIPDGVYVPEEERNFWSFAPIGNPDVPQVKHHRRVRTPIDAFLLRRLEQEQLSFSANADRRTFIRRDP